MPVQPATPGYILKPTCNDSLNNCAGDNNTQNFNQNQYKCIKDLDCESNNCWQNNEDDRAGKHPFCAPAGWNMKKYRHTSEWLGDVGGDKGDDRKIRDITLPTGGWANTPTGNPTCTDTLANCGS